MTSAIITKERPIIFSGPMVRAILEGKKTQTRRAAKGLRAEGVGRCHWSDTGWAHLASHGGCTCQPVRCPYGEPGDRLWVRETFCVESSKEVLYDPPHSDGRPIRHHQDEAWGPWWQQPHYRATDPSPELEIGTEDPGCRWRPSIFMPRWASRITLEITDVRVERLLDISEKDAQAEGIAELSLQDGEPGAWWSAAPDRRLHSRTPRGAFLRLWRSIHGEGSWDANPWVWVVEFRQISPPSESV